MHSSPRPGAVRSKPCYLFDGGWRHAWSSNCISLVARLLLECSCGLNVGAGRQRHWVLAARKFAVPLFAACSDTLHCTAFAVSRRAVHAARDFACKFSQLCESYRLPNDHPKVRNGAPSDVARARLSLLRGVPVGLRHGGRGSALDRRPGPPSAACCLPQLLACLHAWPRITAQGAACS